MTVQCGKKCTTIGNASQSNPNRLLKQFGQWKSRMTEYLRAETIIQSGKTEL